ncbi:MAG: SUMF1/EgtB/PvdO family nonheme iron enzyme [Hyphomicrobiales bacterium]|nr:SUMF1/EgtB/PvdO family nonheme iron enzyme [Hyphomicrobiales bacterium]
MAFRRVEVPSDGWLGDRKVVIGGSDEAVGHAENNRYAYVAGGFTDPATPARRFFYLGKYEVTQMQVDALKADGACPRASMRGRLPATKVSWFDAVAFAGKYTEWLLAHGADALPGEDGAPGFLRLPTEEEWEYAARGGSAVSTAEFQERAFPMPDGMHKYVWFAGARSSNGKMQLTGLLQPNPLGLHDLLGNVDEIVLSPFRLSKYSRLHGQPGGFVIKGGNYLTSETQVRSAYRQEVAHFARGGPNRVATVGFRLAISAPVLTSHERLRQVRADWQALPRTVTVTSGTEPLDDPVAELEVVKQATADPDLRRRLDHLAFVVKSNVASRNEQRDRAVKVVIRLGAFLGRKLQDDQTRLRAIRAILRGRRAANSSPELIAKTERSLIAGGKVLEENFQYYADTVIQAVGDYPDEVFARQLAALAVEFESRDLRSLIPFAELFKSHADIYRKESRIDRKTWLEQIRER